MEKYLALDKFRRFALIIKQNGGIWDSMYKLYRQDELKDGCCVGQDNDGNKYFQNDRYFYGRNRWIEYADKFAMEYDGSQVPAITLQVPAEWFGWLHYKTDLYPDEDPTRPHHKWMAEHTENLSGTTAQYVPYSTTLPKIEGWVPKKKLCLRMNKKSANEDFYDDL